jgi:hypothetical protein
MKIYILLLALLSTLSLAFAEFSLDLETGAAFSGYNDVRIPNNEPNSRFSLSQELKADPVLYGRLNLHYLITPRHELSLLYSPLTIKSTGILERDLIFRGETFLAGKELEGTYRFDSYRLQYLYRFKNQNIIIRAIGISLKLRDAEIGLKNEDAETTKYDTGFVPLIGFEFGYDINDKLALLLKGEALGSPYGRAEDMLLAAVYDINDRFSVHLGYRFLEGGSDIGEVYTFANVNYASLGAQIRF